MGPEPKEVIKFSSAYAGVRKPVKEKKKKINPAKTLMAACAILAVLIGGVAVVWFNGHGMRHRSFAANFMDTYQTRKERNKRLAVESLGLYRPVEEI